MCYTVYYYHAGGAVIGPPVCDTIEFSNNGPAHCKDVQVIKFDFFYSQYFN